MVDLAPNDTLAHVVLQPAEHGAYVDLSAQRGHDALRELCHDLLQPVATIGALLAAAQVETKLPRATKDRLNQVSLEVKRLVELCHHGLDHGAAHAAVALDDVVSQVVATAALTAPGTVHARTQPAVVGGDSTALRRAVANLLDNAIRAAGRGGEVVATVRVDGPWVRVTVADSGAGFGTGASGVAGLGLRIAARVAHDHGGELAVGASVELGGAEVTLSVPAAPPYGGMSGLGGAVTR